MSDTILGGDFTVYYLSENRQKRIAWTGSATGTRTVNELYSALQDLFDELTQMDDGVPMSAQTPTEYTIGIIDPGDDDPWFIDKSTVEHLVGGSIQTAAWARSEGVNTGIIRMGYAETVALVPSDIGKTIVMTSDGDSGTLLDYNSITNELWIRPDSNTAANSFDDAPTANGAWTMSNGTGTGIQSGGSAVSGASLWANIFTLGTIEANTHIYVNQNGALLTAYKEANDWWGDGQIDILVPVREVGSLVDEAVVQVLARQYSKTYSFFETNLSAGGRNPIPLSTGNDLDNQSGIREMVLSTAAGGPYVVGEIIEDDSDATIQGIVTGVSGSNPNVTLQYYLIGDPLDDFSAATGAFTGQASGATATAVNPTAVGPANLSPAPSIVHGSNETFDIDEDGATEDYSIVIDAQNTHTLAEIYEWTKYITRRGSVDTGNNAGIEGQFYIGADSFVDYDSETGIVAEGAEVTQAITGAKGTIVAKNSTNTHAILRNSRGTFDGANNIEVDGSNFLTISTSPTPITPVAAAPYGTFAGGKFFAARGVVFANILAADNNNYQLKDNQNNVVEAPTKVDVSIGNTRALDRVALFRLTGAGGNIEKNFYAISGTPAIGSTSLSVSPAIRVDEPGKTTGGILFAVETGNNIEHRYRFTSWLGSAFTLFATAQRTADAGGSATTLIDASEDFIADGVQIGDIVRNDTESAYAYVTAVASTQLTLTNIGSDAPVTDWSSDQYTLGATVATYTGTGTIYVPFIHAHEIAGTDGSPGSESVNIVYNADVPVRARARQAGDILPYEADGTITNTGFSNNVIRTADTIFN